MLSINLTKKLVSSKRRMNGVRLVPRSPVSSATRVSRRVPLIYSQHLQSIFKTQHLVLIAQHIKPITTWKRYYCQELKDSVSNKESSLVQPEVDHEQLRLDILEKALTYVTKYGWSVDALSLAVEELGLPPTAHGLVQDGGLGLLRYHIDKSNKKMITGIQSGSMNLEEWADALALQAAPGAIWASVQSSAALADEIAFQAGDSSFDVLESLIQMNWYTRRAAIMAVFGSTELFMLIDASKAYTDTWDFLNRRLDDLVEVSKAQSTASEMFSAVVSFLSNPPSKR